MNFIRRIILTYRKGREYDSLQRKIDKLRLKIISLQNRLDEKDKIISEYERSNNNNGGIS